MCPRLLLSSGSTLKPPLRTTQKSQRSKVEFVDAYSYLRFVQNLYMSRTNEETKAPVTTTFQEPQRGKCTGVPKSPASKCSTNKAVTRIVRIGSGCGLQDVHDIAIQTLQPPLALVRLRDQARPSEFCRESKVS